MIAKIKPLPVTHKPGVFTMQNSYAERGWNRQPGTTVGFPPLMGRNGRYATGLDENSDEIMRLIALDEVEGLRVQNDVRERRERLELATGLPLGPTSDYYTKTYDTGFYNTKRVAEKCKLYDKENVFDFSDPFEEVRYWWVIQNKALIAPSLTQWRSGGCKPTVQFYIENEGAEQELVYKKNKSMTDSVTTLTKLNLETRKKVAKLCGVAIGEGDNEMSVYNKLYAFIMEGDINNVKFKNQDSVATFNRIVNLSDAVMNAKFMVEQALEYRIYTKRNGVIYEGDSMIAATEEQLVEQLASSNRTAEYMALEIKINDKKKLSQGIEGRSFLSAPIMSPKSDVAVERGKPGPKAKSSELS